MPGYEHYFTTVPSFGVVQMYQTQTHTGDNNHHERRPGGVGGGGAPTQNFGSPIALYVTCTPVTAPIDSGTPWVKERYPALTDREIFYIEFRKN